VSASSSEVQELLARLVAFDTTSAKSNLELIGFAKTYLDGYGVASTLIPPRNLAGPAMPTIRAEAVMVPTRKAILAAIALAVLISIAVPSTGRENSDMSCVSREA
jgi:hypothetical protein